MPIISFIQRLQLLERENFNQAVYECKWFLRTIEAFKGAREFAAFTTHIRSSSKISAALAIKLLALIFAAIPFASKLHITTNPSRKLPRLQKSVYIYLMLALSLGFVIDVIAALQGKPKDSCQESPEHNNNLLTIVLKYIYEASPIMTMALIEHGLNSMEKVLYKDLPVVYTVAKVELYGVTALEDEIFTDCENNFGLMSIAQRLEAKSTHKNVQECLLWIYGMCMKDENFSRILDTYPNLNVKVSCNVAPWDDNIISKAIVRGDMRTLDILIEYGYEHAIDVNKVVWNGATALSVAAQSNSWNFVERHLDRTLPKHIDAHGNFYLHNPMDIRLTVLTSAILDKKYTIAERCINKGADLAYSLLSICNAPHDCLVKDHKALAEFIHQQIQQGRITIEQVTAAIKSYGYAGIIILEAINELGHDVRIDVNVRSPHGGNAIWHAAYENEWAFVDEHIDQAEPSTLSAFEDDYVLLSSLEQDYGHLTSGYQIDPIPDHSGFKDIKKYKPTLIARAIVCQKYSIAKKCAANGSNLNAVLCSLAKQNYLTGIDENDDFINFFVDMLQSGKIDQDELSDKLDLTNKSGLLLLAVLIRHGYKPKIDFNTRLKNDKPLLWHAAYAQVWYLVETYIENASIETLNWRDQHLINGDTIASLALQAERYHIAAACLIKGASISEEKIMNIVANIHKLKKPYLFRPILQDFLARNVLNISSIAALVSVLPTIIYSGDFELLGRLKENDFAINDQLLRRIVPLLKLDGNSILANLLDFEETDLVSAVLTAVVQQEISSMPILRKMLNNIEYLKEYITENSMSETDEDESLHCYVARSKLLVPVKLVPDVGNTVYYEKSTLTGYIAHAKQNAANPRNQHQKITAQNVQAISEPEMLHLLNLMQKKFDDPNFKLRALHHDRDLFPEPVMQQIGRRTLKKLLPQ